jgi:hypothetical protein
MSQEQPLQSEKLVQVYRARDEWQGSLLAGYLRDNGIETVLRLPPSVPPYGFVEMCNRKKAIDGVFVLQHNAGRARQLVQEFLSAEPDEEAMDALAPVKPRVTKERFTELRAAVCEQRQTF